MLNNNHGVDDMAKKILIVDDEKKYHDKLYDITTDMDIEIMTAECPKKGIEKAMEKRPDIVITDKNMPGGSGNDLAKKIKELYENAIVVGMTSGNPNNFDKKYVDIRLKKSIPDTEYKDLLMNLVEDKYNLIQTDSDVRKIFQSLKTQFIAISVLCQGFGMAVQAAEGKPPSEHMRKGITYEQAYGLLDLDKVGIKSEGIYDRHTEQLRIILEYGKEHDDKARTGFYDSIERFISNPDVSSFMRCIESKNYEEINQSGLNKNYLNSLHEMITAMGSTPEF